MGDEEEKEKPSCRIMQTETLSVANMERRTMRLSFAMCCVLVAVAISMVGYCVWELITPELATDDPRPAAAPWPVMQAAKITYDRDSDTFVLTNVSPHCIWFDGRGTAAPSRFYERQLPGGEWAKTWCDRCGTNRGWHPLKAGQSLSMRSFYRELGTGMASGSPEAEDFARRGGELDKLPARVGLRVTCFPNAERGQGEYVYSDSVLLP